MKNLVGLWLLIVVQCMSLYAEEGIISVNWDKQDSQLFEELKKEHKLEDAQAYELLGRAYLHQDFWEKASICFERAAQLNPKLYLSWYNLGLINIDNPELFFKKAIEANPKFAPPYYWLAMYYKQCGKEVESIEYFDRYLKVVDRNDPQEKSRIKVAEDAVKGVKNGIR